MIGAALNPFFLIITTGQRPLPPVSLLLRLEGGSTTTVLVRLEAAASYINLFGRQ